MTKLEFIGGPLDGLLFETTNKDAAGKLPFTLIAGVRYERGNPETIHGLFNTHQVVKFYAKPEAA